MLTVMLKDLIADLQVFPRRNGENTEDFYPDSDKKYHISERN